ncbi:MAG: zinc ribbon domain-containing protein [Gammaproteobacteria bacterium]|nr:zinc ribbon domain-containing protein [Gammaproteobacteria bacterium]
MPIYEYRCEACGHYLETLQKISDPLLTDCHKCGQPTLKKLVSASAFRLKGSGWYETDFKTGTKKNVVTPDKVSSSSGKSGDKAGSSGDKAGSSGGKSSDKSGSTASTKKSTGS